MAMRVAVTLKSKDLWKKLTTKILFSDAAILHRPGHVNLHNIRIWGRGNSQAVIEATF